MSSYSFSGFLIGGSIGALISIRIARHLNKISIREKTGYILGTIFAFSAIGYMFGQMLTIHEISAEISKEVEVLNTILKKYK